MLYAMIMVVLLNGQSTIQLNYYEEERQCYEAARTIIIAHFLDSPEADILFECQRVVEA